MILLADELKLSKGWLQNFKNRFQLSCFELHGEAAEADMGGVGFALRVLPAILKEYTPQVARAQPNVQVAITSYFKPL